MIARGQTLKARSTQSSEWNWNLTSYSCSTVQDLSVEHFKFIFGQNLEVGNFGPLCAIQECQSVRLSRDRIYKFESIAWQNVQFYRMVQSKSFRYRLHPIWVPSERGAHGTQLEMAVMAISVHHARFKHKLYAWHMETTDSVAFCNNPEASQGHGMPKTHLSFRALYLHGITQIYLEIKVYDVHECFGLT